MAVVDTEPGLGSLLDGASPVCAFSGASDFSSWPTEDLGAEVMPIGEQVGFIVINTRTGERGLGGCASKPLVDAGLTAVLVHPLDGVARMIVWAQPGRGLRTFDWIADVRQVVKESAEYDATIYITTSVEGAKAETPSEQQLITLVGEALASDTTTIALVADDVYE